MAFGPEDQLAYSHSLMPVPQLEQDLHVLYAAAKQLLSAPIPPELRKRIEAMVLALHGCDVCHAMLGELHGSACRSIPGPATVQGSDLAEIL